MKGRLYVCGTPIGNLEDASPRLIRTLDDADVVAAEDTRRTRKLLTRYGIGAKLVSYHDANERDMTKRLLDRISSGERIALVTDGGMPGISDPGYRLIRGAVESGLPIEVVPGPSAVISALAISGLPTARFAFEGFLPKKASEASRRLSELKDDDRTLIFFESPRRLAETLTRMLAVLGDRDIAVARELTKVHEEVIRGSISALLDGLQEEVLGEVTIVVSGAPDVAGNVEDAVERARQLMEDGLSPSRAAAVAASEIGVTRRDVYRALIGKD